MRCQIGNQLSAGLKQGVEQHHQRTGFLCAHGGKRRRDFLPGARLERQQRHAEFGTHRLDACQSRQAGGVTVSEASFDQQVLALDIAEVAHAERKRAREIRVEARFAIG